MDIVFKNSIDKVFPKIIGVGKNYLKHVIQMGGKDIPKEPIIFLKPWTSLVYAPKVLNLSKSTRKNEIHHQIELGVYIGKSGYNISKENAMEYVGGYFLLLDLTDRDIQKYSKDNGLPWQLSKGQDSFCPVSEFIHKQSIKNPHNVEIQLKINNKIVQKDNTGNMYYKISDIISYTSSFMTLTQGDLILTGTPSGVGPIKPGDIIDASLSEEGKIFAKFDFNVI